MAISHIGGLLDAMTGLRQTVGNGGSPMRYGRLADLVRLALKMQGRADGLSLDDIGETFEVSRRTAERMRDAIRDTFPQTEELSEPGGRKRWRLPPGTTGRLADPTVEDIAVLHRGAELARQSGDKATADHLDTLSDRLRARMPGPKRTKLEPDIAAILEADGVALRPGPREGIPTETLNILRQAILAGVWIEVDHRARATGLLSRNARLGPMAMLLGEGRQYLVAYSEWAKDVRLFALAGFERIALTEDTFERSTEFDLSAWMQRSFGIWQEDIYDVVWRFTPEAAPEARLYLFHSTQELTDEPDGSLTVKFRAGGLREMCWHLLRWGDQVKIISPAALRDAMVDHLNKVQKAYS
ncbi:helix-turn-helix transcriptional regulator [Antarcticimicrobium sediminis]|uniref:WYL domain-containing protein n=1 Tax=Antarcticimicrobium sediminis TaxID=2546227 RepID=A0A4R5EHL3_9RHOB|nr:WYL domain-containing protein [Antarcticimicrobium sediminis]TDE33787.1 WYL domain-containing protein [Antarcticimicrobium sediminis]